MVHWFIGWFIALFVVYDALGDQGAPTASSMGSNSVALHQISFLFVFFGTGMKNPWPSSHTKNWRYGKIIQLSSLTKSAPGGTLVGLFRSAKECGGMAAARPAGGG